MSESQEAIIYYSNLRKNIRQIVEPKLPTWIIFREDNNERWYAQVVCYALTSETPNSEKDILPMIISDEGETGFAEEFGYIESVTYEKPTWENPIFN